MTSQLLATLSALAKPVAVCLLLGAQTTLAIHLAGGKWDPALTQGGEDVVKAGIAFLLYGGIAYGVQRASAAAVAKQAGLTLRK